MSAAARGAAGMVALNSKAREVENERLAHMQRDMDEIAAGKLPSRNRGRSATPADVESYRARFSTAAERRKEPAWK
jgi:hypothetical protein